MIKAYNLNKRLTILSRYDSIYTSEFQMIQSFGDRDTKLLFDRERVKKLPQALLQRARNKLLIIHAATNENDLIVPPGNCFEKLKGDKKGWCSIRINDKWRVIFKWAEGNAYDVTITDYH